jgi:hypothetical protein
MQPRRQRRWPKPPRTRARRPRCRIRPRAARSHTLARKRRAPRLCAPTRDPAPLPWRGSPRRWRGRRDRPVSAAESVTCVYGRK